MFITKTISKDATYCKLEKDYNACLSNLKKMQRENARLKIELAEIHERYYRVLKALTD